MTTSLSNRSLELQADLHRRLRDVREPRKALTFAARHLPEALAARDVAAVTRTPAGDAKLVFNTSHGRHGWDLDLLADYLEGRRPRIPSDVMLAPVERRGRNWAVLAVRDSALQFSSAHRQALLAVAQTLSEIVQRVDEDRVREIQQRIVLKIADQQSPKDLIYDILHGIRSLTRYDHSSALLLARAPGEDFTLVAEQIAWTKAKSRRIGATLSVDDEVREQLHELDASLIERAEGGWAGDARLTPIVTALATLKQEQAVPAEVSVLCAPIVNPGGSLGLLKVAARREGVLGSYELDLVRELLPLASLAVQFSLRTETLQNQVLRAERKHVLADLTRGISHDVNNALGAVLPLVQQLAEEASRGPLEPDVLRQDLEHIERSIQTCRRIFSGMLSIARGSARPVGQGNLRRAIETALSVVKDGMRRHSIQMVVELPREIPPVLAGQNDLTQLFLNLFSNARDAMPDGGTLTVQATLQPDSVQVRVCDTGTGIPSKYRDRVFEPFFSTKAEGNGLGLTICGSVVRESGGTISVESEEGQGTRFLLELPVETRDEAAGARDTTSAHAAAAPRARGGRP